jgi:hypothetical protein
MEGPALAAEPEGLRLRLLERIAQSPWRSPLLDYGAVYGSLRDDRRRRRHSDMLHFQLRYIADELSRERDANLLGALRELADMHHMLGDAELAIAMYGHLLHFDPTDVWLYNSVAWTFSASMPELAATAAERGLLLLPRDDTYRLRDQLRSMRDEAAARPASPLSGSATQLLRELQDQPGKRSRTSLRKLCVTLAPGVESVRVKERQPLPNAPELQRIREQLRSLPLPLPAIEKLAATGRSAPPRVSGGSTSQGAARAKVGRNDPCPCGSGAKYERCCAARSRGVVPMRVAGSKAN